MTEISKLLLRVQWGYSSCTETCRSHTKKGWSQHTDLAPVQLPQGPALAQCQVEQKGLLLHSCLSLPWDLGVGGGEWGATGSLLCPLFMDCVCGTQPSRKWPLAVTYGQLSLVQFYFLHFPVGLKNWGLAAGSFTLKLRYIPFCRVKRYVWNLRDHKGNLPLLPETWFSRSGWGSVWRKLPFDPALPLMWGHMLRNATS